ncbi:MAG: hypothetical protein ACLR0N_10225 [Bilophila wadsworthia]
MGRSFSTRCPLGTERQQDARRPWHRYLSSVGAAAFSAASGYAIIPHLSVPTEVSGSSISEAVLVLDIPPLMSVMSALVWRCCQLAVSWTKTEIINALAELKPS